MIRAGLWLALLAVGAGCYVADTPYEDPGKLAEYPLRRVRHVISGDTILLDEGEAGTRLHYAGVEAPGGGTTWWSEAKAENTRLVEGQDVRVIPVPHHGAEAFGYVFIPNASGRMALLVQFELARRGLVRPADLPHALEDEYFDGILLRAEAARRERRGLYADAATR